MCVIKKITVAFIALLLLHTALAQRPCNRLPTAQVLLEGLRHKPVKADASEFLNGCNVTDSIKVRLLYLLNPEWTSDEMKYYVDSMIIENEDIYHIDRKAKSLAKGNDSIYRVVVDSIKKEYQVKLRDYVKDKYRGVSDGILFTVAALDIRKAIPLLKKALKDPAHYNTFAVQLALARLGDTAMERLVLPHYTKQWQKTGYPNLSEAMDKIVRLAYIGTQQSVSRIAQWLDTTTRYPVTAEGDYFELIAPEVIQSLRRIVKNPAFLALSEEYVRNEFPPKPKDNRVILRVRDWLLKNKGRYQIDRNYYTLRF